ncbi:MAG: SurA N-terminal domain-containing protein [Desulfuromonadales bacterium]|jgi:peptidyl-prolyl cis-trans isomerase SurA|nr:SurA N-terminal domain-containing protein [Desulfuromonadales bacterium]
MRYFGIALLLICSIGLTSVSAKVVSRVAAVVNNEIISTHQLDQRLQEQLAKQQKQPSPVQMGALRQELLSRMIEESLVQQRIAALNLTVSEEEIETALVDVQKKNKLSRDDLEDAVQTQGLDFADYRDNLRQQILRYKLISEEVRSQIDVPERELVEYYRAHLEDYRLPPEVELSALSFPVSEKASEQERTQIRKMANEALMRLQQGEALAEVADSYNQTYGATGGSMGKFVYEELTPKFVEAINEVEDGTFTAPVEMGTAIHLLRVDDRLPEGLRQFDAVKFDLHQMILDQKTDVRIKEWTKALKNKAFIDIRL